MPGLSKANGTPAFDQALAEALDRLDRGEDLATVLEHYPQYASRLAPLLTTAQRARVTYAWTEPPSEAALEAGRQELLRQAALQRRQKPLPWYYRLWARVALPRGPMPGLAWGAAAVLLVILVSASTVAAAASSLPGEPLYPVKRAVEQARIALTLDPQARKALADRLAERRRDEVRRVAELGRKVQVAFDGRLEDLGEGSWTVEGLRLVLGPGTAVEGQPRTGARVQVEALSAGDGTLLARKLTVEPPIVTPSPPPVKAPATSPTMEASLTPQRTPTPSLPIHPTGVPGMMPQATIVPTLSPHRTAVPTVTPTMTPQPTATPTMMPAMTPHPTMTPTAVPPMTPHPTMTPTVMPAMTPHRPMMPTASPTATSHPTMTPTQMPAMTPTAVPTMTPHRPMMPTATPHPTDTPVPEPTSTPPTTDTPRPTDTPLPAPTTTPGPPMMTMTPMMTPHPTRTHHP